MKLEAKRRTPSEYRNLLEVRVRRLSGKKSPTERMTALREIREIADAAMRQMRTEGHT